MRLIPLQHNYHTMYDQVCDIAATMDQSYDTCIRLTEVALPLLFFSDHIHVTGQLSRSVLQEAIHRTCPHVNKKLSCLHSGDIQLRVLIQTTSTLPPRAFAITYANMFTETVKTALSLDSDKQIHPILQIIQSPLDTEESHYCMTFVALAEFKPYE